MGNRIVCITTTKREVMQGDAKTHQNRCVTTTTPKGGWGGGEAASPVRREGVRDLSIAHKLWNLRWSTERLKNTCRGRASSSIVEKSWRSDLGQFRPRKTEMSAYEQIAK